MPLMSALGQKRTLRGVRPMSALPPKADIAVGPISPSRNSRTDRGLIRCSEPYAGYSCDRDTLGARVYRAFVSQRVAASVPEHMRVCFEAKVGLNACSLHHPGKAGGCEGSTPLRCEHERRGGLLGTL